MELDYIIPKVRETFGRLEFGKMIEEIREPSRNNNGRVASRRFSVFSDIQKADNIEIILPAVAGVKASIKQDSPIDLVNPRVIAVGYRVENQSFVKYECYADDIVKKDLTK
ncbi:DUF961 family protein [Lacticaseibacillus paracasei]|uniref:Conjugal transfer protein n=1 Tax=Lacticaseibacillus paracasei subsp. paracasei Lpp49 TaxID=1256213 RepID=A0ABC9TB16_LACPA|nr:DUF961 family protein [Lacticaseibacillus paracasei]EPC90461.1 hypothetical protein Lpp49_09982 [Lacticaseibacillus paracasei subsp. paracasei Lpp49]